METHSRGTAGLTLTEILIVVALVAVIVAVAVPAFGPWLRGYRVRSTANQVVAELRLARTVAVSTQASVTLRIHKGECSWTDARGRERRFPFPGGVSITNLADPLDGDTIIFRSDGQVATGSRTFLVDGWVRGREHDVYTIDLAASGNTRSSRGTYQAAAPGGGGGGGGGGDGRRR